DADAAAWLRGDAPERRPCLEAQIMDWADDVAYSVHDVEDGVVVGQDPQVDAPGDDAVSALGRLGQSHGMGGGLAAADLVEAAGRLSLLPAVADVG
ncbi:deoxyguanosinetriphosphate triphosphohydrolase, partial [Mycobacterium sp. ITM-2017-0098]